MEESKTPENDEEQKSNKSPNPLINLPDLISAQQQSAPLFGNFSNAKFQEIFEQHRRIYSTLMEQRKNNNLLQQQLSTTGKSPLAMSLENMLMCDKSRTPIANLQQQYLQEVQKNFAKLEQVLRDELMGAFTGKIDKVGYLLQF